MAGSSGSDLRPGEEKLPPAQTGTGHARDAPWDRGRSHSRLTGDGLLRPAEHGFYRASQSDDQTWCGSARTPHLGDGSADATALRLSGVVARVLSLCPSSRIVAGEARAAPRARGQTISTTLPATDESFGSGKNEPTMDCPRSAHLPLATDFHLRGIEADGVLYHVAGRWVKGPAEERGWSLTLGRKGLSGLPHHQKPAPNGYAEGWSIYPPYPIGVPRMESTRLPSRSMAR